MIIYEKHKKIFLSLIGISALIFMMGYYLTPITTNDFWLQLKVGQLIKENFAIPKTILFAFTPESNNPFVAHEWLPSLFFSLFYDLFGYNFMIVFKCTLYSISFCLALLLSFRITKNALISLFITFVCLFTLNYRSFLRPEAFSYIFFLTQVNFLWLYLERKSLNLLAYYLLVNILWVNSHGSFLLSLALPGLLGFSLVLDRIFINFFHREKNPLFPLEAFYLGAASVASLLTALINPLGYKLLLHSYELSQDDLMKKTIFEWKPMLSSSVMNSSIFPVFLFFMSVLSVFLAFRFTKLRSFSFLLLFIFIFLSFEAQRHLAFLALASVWPISFMLKDLKLKENQSTLLAVSLIIVPVFLAYYSYKHGNTVKTRPGFYYSARIPEETINYIKEKKIEGNTINTYSLGAQLIFHFYPKMKIGIDSRVDAYGVEYARRYSDLIYGDYRPFKEFIDTYDVKNIIIDNEAYRAMVGRGSYENLKKEGWKLTHKNSKVIILEHKS